ncbi:putative ABC transport system permease protein [Streptacidiphilus sp. MAP12-20]|uniref:FtsX-like permease family protein n=1 Tax=Streptacidiphilus sp. MAP12-20 TaxID=3156299 RepID=UPI003518B4E0
MRIPLPLRRSPREAAAKVPWVRARLRRAPGLFAGLALLVLGTTFLATALPLALDHYQDSALHQILRDTSLSGRTLLALPAGPAATNTLPPEQLPPLSDVSATGNDPGNARSVLDAMRTVADQAVADVGAPIAIDRSAISYGVHSSAVGTEVANPAGRPPLPAPDGVPPRVIMGWQPSGMLQLVAGRLPHDPVLQLGDNGVPVVKGTLEVAVSRATATEMNWTVGSRIVLTGLKTPAPQTVIVGIYANPTAQQARNLSWESEPLLGAPHLTPDQNRPANYFWRLEAWVPPGAVAALSEFHGSQAYWWLPIATDKLTGRQAPAAAAEINSLTAGDAATQLMTIGQAPGGLTVSSELGHELNTFVQQRDAITPVITVGVAGTAGTAAAVLLMVFGLAAERRAEELALLRARGAGLRFLLSRLLAESLLCTTPAAAVGILAALLLLPSGDLSTAVLFGAAVWAFATVAGVVRAVARRRGAAATRSDVTVSRPSRRRTVMDLFALVLTAAAVVALRQRGLGRLGQGGLGIDPLTAAAPVLLGFSGALLLMRCYPLPLRLATRPTVRRRGAIGFLGLARAARTPATGSLLPLLALLLALTTAVFGQTVLSGVAAARADATVKAVGADGRVETNGPTIDQRLVDELRRTPGVRDSATVETDPQLAINPMAGTRVTLDVVDPVPYARISAAVGLGPFDPSQLGSGTARPGEPIPVLASQAAADQLGTHPTNLVTIFGPVTVRLVGVLPTTPASPTGDFVLAPAGAVLAVEQARTGSRASADLVLLRGHVDGAVVRALVNASPERDVLGVFIRAELQATLDSTPLPSGATRLYQAAVVATTLLALLAVLLSLIQAAPARAALLARLRTMGLRPRQGYALILTEALPVIALAAVAGSVLGMVSVPVLGAGIDLSQLSGAVSGSPADATPAAPAIRAAAVIGPAGALLLLAVLVVALESAVIGRRQIGAQLRAGDGA